MTKHGCGIHAFLGVLFGVDLSGPQPDLSPLLRVSAVRFGFYFRFRAAAIDSLSAAARSESLVVTCAGFGMCDSRPAGVPRQARFWPGGVEACAHRLAISHGEPSFTPHRHPFTGPAMRRSHRNPEIARNRRPAFEGAFGGGLGLLFGTFCFHDPDLIALWQPLPTIRR